MAPCNDTNCPDLNAVIGPLATLLRKWLQLRLFHFLATMAQVYNLKKETLCITCAPQLKMQPNEGEIAQVQQTLARVGAQTQKWKHVCVKWVFSLIW